MRPEAGWYPDPSESDRLRWWDGQGWTTETVPAEGSRPAVQPSDQSISLAKPVRPATQAPASAPGAAPAALPPGSPWADPPTAAQQPGYGQPVTAHQASQQAAPVADQHQAYQQFRYQQPYPPSAGTQPIAARTPHTADGAPLGNVWRRLAARVIDYLVVLLVVSLLTRPFADDFNARTDELTGGSSMPSLTQFQEVYSSPEALRFALATLVASLLLAILYEGVMLRYLGATIGKLVWGLKVVPSRGGTRLGWGQALGRPVLVLLLNRVTCLLWALIDSMWCLFDNNRRVCLHDIIFRTQVISTR